MTAHKNRNAIVSTLLLNKSLLQFGLPCYQIFLYKYVCVCLCVSIYMTGGPV